MTPETLGRYRVVGVLGRGGMGVVYEGHDPQIDRAVAIKTIALDALNEQERALFEGRFQSEMRSTGRLQHHNIVALYDTGRDGGTAYIVMERVEGQDLKRHLAAGRRFSVGEALDIAVQLLAALEYAHRRQVIHRDVKPANVMLQTDGTVKLCDFGVARLADADATRTQGMVVGSLRYAAPEQILGQGVDARTDVYATGVLLFELLTGELPFKGQSDVEMLHRIAHEQAPSPRSIVADIPADIDAAVRRALSRDPADRYASAAEFARALGASSAGTTESVPVAALPPLAPPPQTTAAPAAAHPLRWLAAAGGGALVLAGAAWFLRHEPPAAGPAPVLAPLASAPSTAAAASAPATISTASASPPASQTAAAPSSSPPASAAIAIAAATPAVPRAGKPAASATATKPAAPARPGQGAWRGQLACGAVLGSTGRSANAGPFTAALAIDVSGSRISWTRDSNIVSETVVGSFDGQGRFSAEGQGSRKDRSEYWRETAQGQFLPATRRIEGQLQVLRASDNKVARECTLVADREGAAASVQAAAPPPASAAKTTAAPAIAQGAWAGTLACGALLHGAPGSARSEAFEAPVKVEVAGTHIGWTRESKTAIESASGSFDNAGRFTAQGRGAYKDEAQRRPWLVQARGELVAQGRRIQAQVQLQRASDGALSRECTLSAEHP